MTPAQIVRERCRRYLHTGPTSGLAPGAVQANLVIVPQADAYDFLLFCQRNPRPCPIIDVTDAGDPTPRFAAPLSDLRTDLPRYHVWRDGVMVREVLDITDDWRKDLVAFLIGCSFTFENALQTAGIPVRHVELGSNVPMYRTSRPCRAAGKFHGPLVVSMRPIAPALIDRAVAVCQRFPESHGPPVHIGDPASIGIPDIRCPDYGSPPTIHPGEVPVFWACGVTPQAALASARLPFAITHSPGHMFLTDLVDSDFDRIVV